MEQGDSPEMGMEVKRFTASFLNELVNEAKNSDRARQHKNIHESYLDPCQRLFNAIGVDSYIRPHRHLLDRKVETLIAIRGVMILVTFDDVGRVVQGIRFGCGGLCNSIGVELSPRVWHTVMAEVDGSVLLEMKAGPFDSAKAKEFADWAPAEGTAKATVYLSELKSRVRNNISILI